MYLIPLYQNAKPNNMSEEVQEMQPGLDGTFQDYEHNCSTNDLATYRKHNQNTENSWYGKTSCSGRCGEQHIPFEYRGKVDPEGVHDPFAMCPNCRTKLGMPPLEPHLVAKMSAEQRERFGLKLEEGAV